MQSTGDEYEYEEYFEGEESSSTDGYDNDEMGSFGSEGSEGALDSAAAKGVHPVVPGYVLGQVGGSVSVPVSEAPETHPKPLFCRLAKTAFSAKKRPFADLSQVPTTRISRVYPLAATSRTLLDAADPRLNNFSIDQPLASTLNSSSSSNCIAKRHSVSSSSFQLKLQGNNSSNLNLAHASLPANTSSSLQTIQKVARILPSFLNLDLHARQDNHEMISLSENSTRATYIGPGHRDSDSASVRANWPAPRSHLMLYYFEVFVVSRGRDGWMGVGCCTKDVNLNRLPGWDSGSYGYHGDDGCSFEGTGKGNPYGPTYSAGDTIGCIINFRDNSISFTKNGLLLGVAFKNIRPDLPLYPAVGFRTPGECMQVNFGAETFKFDINSYVVGLQTKLWKSVIQSTSIPIPNVAALKRPSSEIFAEVVDTFRQARFSDSPTMLLHTLILDHLEHNGYHETAAVFRKDAVNSSSNDGIAKSQPIKTSSDLMDTDDADGVDLMAIRRKLRTKTMKGDIPAVFSLLSTHFPTVLSRNRHLHFALLCHQFIESVSQSLFPLSNPVPIPHASWEEHLIDLGRHISHTFSRDTQTNTHIAAALDETFSLAAYPADTLMQCLTKSARQATASPATARKSSGGSRRISAVSSKGSAESFKSALSSPAVRQKSIARQQQQQQQQQQHQQVPDSVLQLLDPSSREHVATLLDACVLEEMGRNTDSILERELKQCVVQSQILGEHGACVLGVDVLKSVWNDCD